jgi:hypothetical protein
MSDDIFALVSLVGIGTIAVGFWQARESRAVKDDLSGAVPMVVGLIILVLGAAAWAIASWQ